MRTARPISPSRPTTGSRRPSRARAVRLRGELLRSLDRGSSSREGAARPEFSRRRQGESPACWSRAAWSWRRSAPDERRTWVPMAPPSRSRPSSRCSVPIRPPPEAPAAFSITRLARGVSPWAGASPGRPEPTARTISRRTRSAVTCCAARHRPAAPLLPQQAQQQVLAAHIAVAQLLRRRLGKAQGVLGSGGELVFPHGCFLLRCQYLPTVCPRRRFYTQAGEGGTETVGSASILLLQFEKFMLK